MSTATLSREEEFRAKFLASTVLENPFIPHRPHPKQAEFCLETGREVLFGGAAGGGKSDALLMAALQFVTVPGYSAIIFRRTYADLSLPKALMSRAREWLTPTAASWSAETKTWTFPSGATLTFGYLDTVNDRFRYQSSEFQFCAFDELTQFPEVDYRYLFSRLRRLKGSNVPIRMRAGTNPGGVGHLWVKKRFGIRMQGGTISIDPGVEKTGRRFIPSFLDDNPSLDEEEYVESLGELDLFTKNQLLKGNWADFKGNHFFPGQWPVFYDLGDAWALDTQPVRTIFLKSECTILIAIDWATSVKKTSDFTAIVVAALTPAGHVLILEVVNERIRLEHCAGRLAGVCARWEPSIVAGDNDILSSAMLLECRRHREIPEVRCLPIKGKAKIIRAQAGIIMAENGRFYRPAAAPAWWEDYTDQLAAFTGIEDAHDDMVDASGVIARLANLLKGITSAATQEEPVVLLAGREMW